MSHIIQSFGNWKALNEDSAPGSVTVRARMGQKVVLTPIDDKTLKIKIKNDADVLDASQKLTASGFKALVDFIKTQPTIIGYYPTLNDLVTNIVIYTTERDSPSTQVITFNIGSKTELGGSINSQVQYARQDELELIKTGSILNVPSALKAADATAKLTLPVANSKISGSKDANLVAFFKDAYLKIKKDTVAAANTIMAKVKAEIAGGALGENSRLFAIGLNAGFGIKDWSGEDYEQDITKTLVDKLALITATSESTKTYLGITGTHLVTEAASAAISGFDPDLFNSEITRVASVSTGDIVVPAGGFKEGLKGDAELKKFQNLLIKKYAGLSGKVASYNSLVAAGTMEGNYGPKTKAFIAFLKAALSKPKWDPDGNFDTTGSVIEPEFVARIQAETEVNESSFYLSLTGFSLVTENLDIAAGLAATGQTATVNTSNRDTSRRSTSGGQVDATAPAGKVYELQGVPDYEYTLIKKIVNFRKKGSKDKWGISTNAPNIKKVISIVKKEGLGYAFALIENKALVDNRHYVYSDNKWQVWINGAWEPTIATTTAKLEAFYGKGSPYSSTTSGTSTSSTSTSSTSTGATTTEIDKALIDIGTAIKTFIEDPSKFAAYKGWNDDEDLAWQEVLKPEYDNNWKTTINKISIKVKNSTAIKETDKKRYRTSIDTLRNMWIETAFNTVGTFYRKFQGSESSDTFDLKLLLAGSGVKRISIECDF